MFRRKISIIVAPFVILGLVLSVFILSFWGFSDARYLESQNGDVNWMGMVYAVLVKFVMSNEDPYFPNWQLAAATYIAAGILSYGIFLSVYRMASVQLTLFWIQAFYKNHTVIFGAGRIGYRIAIELLRTGEKVVVVEKDRANDNVSKIRALGGLALIGNAFEETDLLKAGVTKAKDCLILTGNDENNLQAANLLSYLNSEGAFEVEDFRAQIHVDDWYNTNFLKDYLDLYNRTDHFNIDPFSANLAAAQMIFDRFSPIKHVQYRTVQDDTGRVVKIEATDNSIAVIGYTATAEMFLIECIILSHSPGLKNLKVLLIDRDVEEVVRSVYFKFPFIDRFLDIVPVELSNENFYGEQFTDPLFLHHCRQLSGVYIFGDHDAYSMGLANSFRQLLYAETGDLNNVPIVVDLPEQSSILELLNPYIVQSEGEEVKLFTELRENFNINVIKHITDTCTKAKVIDEIDVMDAVSKTINYFYSMKYEFVWLMSEEERNRVNESGVLDRVEKLFLEADFKTDSPTDELETSVLTEIGREIGKSVGELRPVFGIDERWNALGDLKQDSNRYVARHLEIKVDFLRKMGYDRDIDRAVIEKYYKALAPIEHKRWESEKLSFKFRYGPFPKDKKLKKLLKDSLKIHDQIIPYEHLTKEMEDKDFNMFLLITVLKKVKDIVTERMDS